MELEVSDASSGVFSHAVGDTEETSSSACWCSGLMVMVKEYTAPGA